MRLMHAYPPGLHVRETAERTVRVRVPVFVLMLDAGCRSADRQPELMG